MWLLSSGRQGMLTQGSAPDPKCKLIISSFLTLPHLLDYLICTRNAMPIALLQMMGVMGQMGVADLYQWVGRGEVVDTILLFLYFSYALFCSLRLSVPLFRWLEHHDCYVCFFFLNFLSLLPSIRSDQCIEIVVSVWVKLL